MKNFLSPNYLFSASVNLLNVNLNQSAPHLRTLLHVPDFAPQITPKIEPAIKSLKTISTPAIHSLKHEFLLSTLSPAPRNQSKNTGCSLNNSKYVYPAPIIPINTPFANRNSPQFKQLPKIGMKSISWSVILISLSTISR